MKLNVLYILLLTSNRYRTEDQIPHLKDPKNRILSVIISLKRSGIACEQYRLFLQTSAADDLRRRLLPLLGSHRHCSLVFIVHFLTLMCLLPVHDETSLDLGSNQIMDILRVHEIFRGRLMPLSSTDFRILCRLAWRATHLLQDVHSNIFRECLQLPALDKRHKIFDLYLSFRLKSEYHHDCAVVAAVPAPVPSFIYLTDVADVLEGISTFCSTNTDLHDELMGALLVTVKICTDEERYWSQENCDNGKLVPSLDPHFCHIKRLMEEPTGERTIAALESLRETHRFFENFTVPISGDWLLAKNHPGTKMCWYLCSLLPSLLERVSGLNKVCVT